MSDICRLAITLARNAHFAVFPCRADKAPATPHGLCDASQDPAEIAELWDRYPGPLVGIATGTASGVSVLDVDHEGHPEAAVWWRANYGRLMPTRVFATRRNGLHAYFQHRGGVRNTQGKLAPGVDSRGAGGYAISWWCAGLACHDHSPAAPMPSWLFEELTRQPPAPAIVSSSIPDDRAIDGIIRRVAGATNGQRNAILYWASSRLVERGNTQQEAESMLMPAAQSCGLDHSEILRTIASAFRRAVA